LLIRAGAPPFCPPFPFLHFPPPSSSAERLHRVNTKEYQTVSLFGTFPNSVLSPLRNAFSFHAGTVFWSDFRSFEIQCTPLGSSSAFRLATLGT